MSDERPSTLDEIRTKAAQNAFEDPELVTMPSGLKFILRRPKPIWWVLAKGNMPQGLGLQARGDTPEPLDAEQLAAAAPMVVRLVEGMFVEPTVKMGAPIEGPELNPNLIGDEDFAFLMKYAGGEVAADGSDLGAFRGRTGTSSSGGGRGAMEVPAKSAAGTDGSAGLSD